MIDQLIPTVDLKQYTDGDEHSQQAFVQSFGEAMREFGFAILDHHGVEQSLVDKNYALWAWVAAQTLPLPYLIIKGNKFKRK